MAKNNDERPDARARARRAYAVAFCATAAIVVGSFLTTSHLARSGAPRPPVSPATEIRPVERAAVTPQIGPYRSRLSASRRLVTDVGCVADVTAASLDEKFSAQIGPLLGLDNPHIIELDGERRLWLFNDAFLDYAATTDVLHEPENPAAYLHSMAMLERDGCFELVHLGDQADPRPFEEGDTFDTLQRFYWPLGGEIGAGGQLYVFWAKMQQDKPPGAWDGIRRHPVETWIGVYDPDTLERLAFEPAPNSGVQPQYGYAVQSDGRYSYLFGNSNQLNLAVEGGYENGPFTATRMYLARVRRGQFLSAPEYFTGAGWSPDPDQARPISERYYTENGMQPRLIDGRWVSITKEDGFWTDTFVFDIAEHPWGPWRTISEREIEPRYGRVQVSYHPILMPWRSTEGDLVVMASQNAAIWDEAVQHPPYYRPMVFSEPWPFDP